MITSKTHGVIFSQHGALMFLLRWLITTVGVWVAVELVPGIEYDRWQSLVMAALVLGILNTFVKPVIAFFSLPLIIVSFGLFLVVINAILLQWTAAIVPGFIVEKWSSAFLASIIISAVSILCAGKHVFVSCLART